MTTIKTIIHDGRLRLDEPLDLPEGSEVEVTVSMVSPRETLRGMTEEEQGSTPEAIARWIEMVEAMPAPEMSDEEWEAWQQRRKEDREWEFANAAEREKRLQSYLE